jgi:hypothetical protein
VAASAETHQRFEVVNSKGEALMVSVSSGATAHLPRRARFMKGEITVPEDFDTMCQDEILQMFGIVE